MKTKRIEWSYPTSTNAKRFGFAKAGCWTVQIVYPGDADLPPIAMAGYSSKEAATQYAATLSVPWDISPSR